MSKFSTELSDKDWVAVSRTSDDFASIKIASMSSNFELEIEVPNELLYQLVSQTLVTFGEPHKDEIAVCLAQDIIAGKDVSGFNNQDCDCFSNCDVKQTLGNSPKGVAQPKAVTYSTSAFEDLFNW
jgi:hypothetical protein